MELKCLRKHTLQVFWGPQYFLEQAKYKILIRLAYVFQCAFPLHIGFHFEQKL